MNKLAAQMARMARVQNRVEALMYLQCHNLAVAHAYLSIENTSGKLPYHNNDHAMSVVKWCGRLESMMAAKTATSVRGLLLGATFHDIKHSGGKNPDSENVSDALDQLAQFWAIHKRTFVEEDLKVAKACIECTVFPFTVQPVTIEQAIIRDADILQYIDVDFETILGTSLHKEIEVSKGEKITRKQFAAGTLAFLDTIEMFTTQGQIIWAAAKPVLVERFTQIAEGVK